MRPQQDASLDAVACVGNLRHVQEQGRQRAATEGERVEQVQTLQRKQRTYATLQLSLSQRKRKTLMRMRARHT